ncbi:MAG: NAD(P)/FAD-dependent oxidoreductase, partial [Candidatus Omnitrophota bacterium]
LEMDKADVIVIGAGVVGLAVAARLSDKGKDVIAVEKHPTFGRETSSRNSEVIHSGIYYPKSSLKAKFCLEGKELLYEFCERYAVPHKKIGKLIVAVNSKEEKELESLIQQGHVNGVSDLILLNKEELRRAEPNIEAVAAIESPSTGIVDTHRLMKTLELQAKDCGTIFAYGCEAVGIEKSGEGYEVIILDADGERISLGAKVVVNSAGLYSDKIASMAGIDTEDSGYLIHYCKGEYFRVGGGKAKLLNKLIYPVPKKTNLGVHTVVDMQGELKLGPNAFYVEDLNYDVDASHAGAFHESVKGFLPFIDLDDLSPDTSGIRPKIQSEGDEFKDFVISNETGKGMPGFINLIGIESPGLTASLSIAKYIETMI